MIKKLLALCLSLFAAIAFAAVDVNKATPAELDGVKGIGPAIAAKITTERAKGNFKDWQDFIDRVGGVGEKSAAKLSEAGLTVNGATFNGIAAKPAAAPAKADAKADTKKEAAPAAAAAPAKADAKPAEMSAADKKAAKAEEKAAKKAAADKEKADKKAAKEAAAADAKKAKAEKAAAKGAKPAASAASAAKK